MKAYKCDICGRYCDDTYKLDSDLFDIYPSDKEEYGIKGKYKIELRDICECCFGKIKGYIHGMYLKRSKESETE